MVFHPITKVQNKAHNREKRGKGQHAQAAMYDLSKLNDDWVRHFECAISRTDDSWFLGK